MTILFVDMNYIIHYIIGFFIMTMLYNHPLFNSYLKEAIEYFNFVAQFQNMKAKLTDKSKNTFLS